MSRDQAYINSKEDQFKRYKGLGENNLLSKSWFDKNL
jgi:hypothetical protein